MSILIANGNERMGYICHENEDDHHLPENMRSIIANFWVKDSPIKRIMYNSKLSLYNDMKTFVGSYLAIHTELHKAKAFMGEEFIQYYERNVHHSVNT